MVTVDVAPHTELTDGTAAPSQERRWWPWVLALAAAVVAASLAVPAWRHQWALSFVRQGDHFTSLSFHDPSTLPSSLTAGTPLHLSFTVSNDEGHRTRYPYVVTSANAVGSQATTAVVARGSLALPAGEHTTMSVSVVPACSRAFCRVQISLPGHPETIDVLVHLLARPA